MRYPNNSKPGLLYRAASHFCAMAIPTLVATPCPSGPVVVSTPEVHRYSGCPAQRLPNCRKDLMSSRVTEGLPRISYSGSTALTLARCKMVYRSVEACPAESTKRSRFIQIGSSGSNRRSLCHKQYTVGDIPMGVPGCPEFACWIASMASVRMVLMQSSSVSSTVCVVDISVPAFFRTSRLAAQCPQILPAHFSPSAQSRLPLPSQSFEFLFSVFNSCADFDRALSRPTGQLRPAHPSAPSIVRYRKCAPQRVPSPSAGDTGSERPVSGRQIRSQ